ncbi:hypothetical protein AN639_06425 [Candidatus Epulonipiscium fishelsonii]|uniref:Uncharacterized protein n=1 Tax=Candidatus Epulonipiscium fishelsonii TaxID=77094 RepID=A0ACC8XAT7_9FIRM|nr:hypothetical protein AN639_06425 [Epulopiscium sp. SCG-B05WGA-EpuloA1]ONI39455.1 hypothetical protein AN396_08610 [Epulopiscium sp. SCG-B11WGA-EpuloA1]
MDKLSKEVYKNRINKTQEILKREQVDAYIIKTKEGSDKVVENLFGYEIVGEAYIVVTPNKCYAITSVIDAQDSEECGFFEKVTKYNKTGPKTYLVELLDNINPTKIMINISQNNYKADGFTVGSYRDFIKIIGDKNYNIISMETFIDEIF